MVHATGRVCITPCGEFSMDRLPELRFPRSRCRFAVVKKRTLSTPIFMKRAAALTAPARSRPLPLARDQRSRDLGFTSAFLVSNAEISSAGIGNN
ncbi:hypothetical protein K0M31_002717, partial [Melipona bicolor]